MDTRELLESAFSAFENEIRKILNRSDANVSREIKFKNRNKLTFDNKFKLSIEMEIRNKNEK